MKILVDFDNTVQLWGTPKADAVETLREWIRLGHVVIIYTSRPESDFPDIYTWLQSYGVRPSDIVHKPYADLYIDDRSVNPRIGWDEIRRVVSG